MYNKDFLKQLLHPDHFSKHQTSVKNNRKQIEKKRNEFSISKLAKNPTLRKFLKLSDTDNLKQQSDVNIKTADKDVMQHIAPKKYLSPLHFDNGMSVVPYKDMARSFTKSNLPSYVTDSEIKIAHTHNMFDWFPLLVNKVHKDGTNMTGKLPSLQKEVIKKLKIGNEDVYSYTKPDGSIRIDVQSPHAAHPSSKTKTGIFTMEYTPPKTHIDKTLNIMMHVPAEFKYSENAMDDNSNIITKEVHPNYAKSDTLPLESKLTGRHISALRNYKK
jgi:hypothetical protein